MTVAPFHPDRREFGRRNSLLHGWLVMEGRPRISVLVRNVSEGGALLECPVPKSMPFRFQLIIESKGFEATCEARHQSETWIGVSFVELAKVEEPIAHWSALVEYSWTGANDAARVPRNAKSALGRGKSS
jgi:hypothetical protein